MCHHDKPPIKESFGHMKHSNCRSSCNRQVDAWKTQPNDAFSHRTQGYPGVCFAFLRIPNKDGSCSAEASKNSTKMAPKGCQRGLSIQDRPCTKSNCCIQTYNTKGVLSHQHSRRACRAAEQKPTWAKVLAWTMCIVFFNPNMGNYQYMGSSH